MRKHNPYPNATYPSPLIVLAALGALFLGSGLVAGVLRFAWWYFFEWEGK